MSKSTKCRAKNPATCRTHGTKPAISDGSVGSFDAFVQQKEKNALFSRTTQPRMITKPSHEVSEHVNVQDGVSVEFVPNYDGTIHSYTYEEPDVTYDISDYEDRQNGYSDRTEIVINDSVGVAGMTQDEETRTFYHTGYAPEMSTTLEDIPLASTVSRAEDMPKILQKVQSLHETVKDHHDPEDFVNTVTPYRELTKREQEGWDAQGAYISEEDVVRLEQSKALMLAENPNKTGQAGADYFEGQIMRARLQNLAHSIWDRNNPV